MLKLFLQPTVVGKEILEVMHEELLFCFLLTIISVITESISDRKSVV